MTLVKKSLGPQNRAVANVEAEKGETVLTNMSRGLDNIVEMYNIQGSKHTQGGTPLNLPTDDNGTGTSFVFSDKLKITDPAVLKLFGSNKNVATYADVSKKHVSIINDSKKLLLDKEVDEFTKTSAEKNIETSMNTLNKLKILQESAKGFPTGLPNGSEQYLSKMGVDPESLLSPSNEMQTRANAAEEKAYGGIVRRLQKAGNGIDLKQFGDKDPEAKNQYIYIQNVLSKQPGFKDALWAEYQKISKNPDYYGKGYQNVLGDDKSFSKIAFKDKDELFNAYMTMQGRNLMFKSNGYDVASTGHNPSDNTLVNQWANQHGAPLPNMDGIVKEQISYRAFENLVHNQGEYKDQLANVMQPFEDVQFGAKDDQFRGQPYQITLADGAYTNTSAGQISRFNPEKFINYDQPDKLTFTPKEGAPEETPTGGIPDLALDKKNLENPLGYRSQDIRNLNRALESRAGLRKYQPFAVTPDVAGIDAAYYSPERAIAAINENVKSAAKVSETFGDAQGATAGALALSGNAFTAVADAIGNYADRNVNLFNNVATANSEIATRRSALDAQTRTSLYSENVDMNEKFRRGVEMAKDKIVLMKNAAETNMADRYNANLLNEQVKVDPLTGLTYFTNLKDGLEKSAPSKNMAEEFNSFRRDLSPDISDDLAYKLFVSTKTGKIVKDDPVVTPNGLTE